MIHYLSHQFQYNEIVLEDVAFFRQCIIGYRFEQVSSWYKGRDLRSGYRSLSRYCFLKPDYATIVSEICQNTRYATLDVTDTVQSK